jgi:MOSC domain-containing protein YiiM
MRRSGSGLLLAGVGLAGDRYALGGGTWADWPGGHKQLTLIAADDVVAVSAAATGAPLAPGATRRNLVTRGVELPALVGGFLVVGGALLRIAKRCPPCRHLERLTGAALLAPMAHRGGVNADVVVGGPIGEGDAVRPVADDEAAALAQAAGSSR